MEARVTIIVAKESPLLLQTKNCGELKDRDSSELHRGSSTDHWSTKIRREHLHKVVWTVITLYDVKHSINKNSSADGLVFLNSLGVKLY